MSLNIAIRRFFAGCLILLSASFSYANHAALRVNPFNVLPDSDANTFRTNSRIFWDHEQAQQDGRARSSYVYSGGIHAVSGTLTSAAFATEAFVPERVNQSSTAITYAAIANDVCWTMISSDNDGITGWTRVGTTAYYYQCEGDTTPNRPTLPSNSAWLMQITVSAGGISAVTDLRRMGIDDCLSVPTYGTFASVVATLSTTATASICIDDVTHVTTSLTVPVNVSIRVRSRGSFHLSSGQTITHNGRFVVEGDPLRQIFTLDGGTTAPIVFGPGYTDVLYVEWWGARADGIVDSTAAINRAITAANGRNGGCVQLAAGRYRITDTIQLVGAYSTTDYPDVLVIGVGLCGAGTNATFIEWNSTLKLQNVRKAAIMMGGNYARLTDLTLISPRFYSNVVSGFATYNTAYYGIVFGSFVTWKTQIRNVNVFFFHVGFSAGIIKRFATTENGLEFEPAGGGTAMSVDAAQLSLENVRIDARTQEFFDGTLVASTQNNANGTNLSRGVGHTTSLTGAAFSDGSYAIELGAPQTVAFTCNVCTLLQENTNVNGTIRVHDVGNAIFTGSTILAPPPSGGFSYALFEKIDSGGSHVVFNSSYHIGGIYRGNTTQGSIYITNGNGENGPTTAFNGEVRLFAPLDGTAINSVLHVNGLAVGRGSQLKSIQLSGATQGANPIAPFGTNAGFSLPGERFRFRGVLGVDHVLWGHEPLNDSPGHLARFDPALNLIPADVPAVLRGKPIFPTFLHTSLYDPIPGVGAANFGESRYHEGIWHLIATAGITHVYAPLARVDAATALNVCANVYVLMVGATPISALNDEIRIVIRFYDAAKLSIGTALSMVGSSTPTNNYNLLLNGRSVRICNYHIVPPTGTIFIGLAITAAPVAARTLQIGVGKIQVIPAPAEVAVEGIAPPLYAATAAPTTGTWALGDRVANSAPAVGQPKGWLCTVAGTPGTWVSEGNL